MSDSQTVMPDPLTETQFKEAFEFVADQVGIPQVLRAEFCKELFSTTKAVIDPRKQTSVVEKYINLFDFRWEEGSRFVSMYHAKSRNPRKQYAELLGNYIIFRAYFIRNFEKHQRTKLVFPYLLLHPFMNESCPVHVGAEYLVLPVDHIYWKQHELVTSVFCRCRHSPVRLKELEKYRKEGVSGYDSPVYDENGRPTGHIHTKLFPIKETPP